jgi:hypothetical protein
MYRHGITKSQLVQKVDWLRSEVEARGMRVANTYALNRTNIVNDGTLLFFFVSLPPSDLLTHLYVMRNDDAAVKHLGATIVERRQNVLEAAIASRHEYKNMLVLGQYRNKIAHLFFREGVVACALYALGGHGAEAVTPTASSWSSPVSSIPPTSPAAAAVPLSASAVLSAAAATLAAAATRRSGSSDSLASESKVSVGVPTSDELSVGPGNGAPREALLKEMRFLHSLLHREFIYQDHPDTPEDFEATLTSMMKRGIITESNGRIQVATRGESMFSFLCALLWPCMPCPSLPLLDNCHLLVYVSIWC